MEVKDAVKRAKAYLAELFADEGLTGIGLEEVEQDEATGDWRITLSMSRARPGGIRPLLPDFKMVVVRENGDVRAVKHRTFAGG